MNDDIHGIFDDINPDDFHRESSTVHEYPLQRAEPDEYGQFLAEQLRHVRFAYAAADGEINSTAVLANTTTVRVFTPQEDELVRDYAHRLTAEAKLMNACWLFIATKTKVGVVLTGSLGTQADEVYADDKQALAVADEMGSSKEAVYWYAERRDAPDIRRRHGYLEILGSDRLGAQQDGEVDQPIKVYGSILGPAE